MAITKSGDGLFHFFRPFKHRLFSSFRVDYAKKEPQILVE